MSSWSSDEDDPPCKKTHKVEKKIISVEEISDEEVDEKEDEIQCVDVIETARTEKSEEMSAEETMKQFAEITATDEILAQTILQDVGWDLKRALDVFYGSDAFKQARAEVVMGPSSSSGSSAVNMNDLKGFEINVMSWNIDGLDGRSLLTRMKAVAKIVKT
uniref:UBA-like domain-containing protein n=1 Tax=Caenorhabditis japonica TaxID=281687 RepID=A0A8R1IAF9_CAEJA